MEITLRDILSILNETKLRIIGIILFLGISAYVLFLASTDPKALISRTNLYALGVTLPLLIGLYLLLVDKFSKETLYVIMGVFIFILLIYLYISTNISKYTLVGYLITIIIFFIVFIGLILISNLISNNAKRDQGWVGFITNFILYIPCLANDFIGYVLKDYYSTPQIFITLFIILILLILALIYVMPMLKSYIKNDGVLIQDAPVFLSQLTALDSGKVRTITTNTMTVEIDASGNKIFTDGGNNNLTNVRANYSISLWVFLNPPNTSRIPIDSESNVFYYGSVSSIIPYDNINTENNQNNDIKTLLQNTPSGTSFHPQITYAIDSSSHGYYKIYVDSQKVDSQNIPIAITIDTDTMPYQKWNNVVLTYSDNTVDIFINGNLVRSKHLSSPPNYTNYDVMVIGTDSSSLYMSTYENTDPDLQGPTHAPTAKPILDTTNRNGLYGAVCNVMYYPIPLDQSKIALNYNYLIMKKIPVFSGL